jgi:hypothetical protein
MVKLIIGVKGTGKTKTLIEKANGASEVSKGSVVCIEKGNKLLHEIKYTVRLLDTKEYGISGASELYGFVAGIYASNHDVTHIFIDSALKICDNEISAFEKFMLKAAEFGDKNSIIFTITSSIPTEECPESLKQFLI